MNNAGKVFLGFAVGAAAGAVAGMLMAPDKGENTRKKVTDQSNRVKDDVNSRLQQGIDRVNELTDSAFNLVNSYKEKMKGEEGGESNIPVQNKNNYN